MGRGGGNDGGVIAVDRSILVRQKREDRSARDKERINQAARWRTCALSSAPLSEPVVADEYGSLFNKEAMLQYVLEKRSIPALSHIRSLKRDVFQVRFTRADSAGRAGGVGGTAAERADGVDALSALFICPITLVEANGTHPFVCLRPCGCAMSLRAVREIGKLACPLCGTAFRDEQDLIRLCPTEDEMLELRDRARAAAAASAAKPGGAVATQRPIDPKRSRLAAVGEDFTALPGKASAGSCRLLDSASTAASASAPASCGPAPKGPAGMPPPPAKRPRKYDGIPASSDTEALTGAGGGEAAAVRAGGGSGDTAAAVVPAASGDSGRPARSHRDSAAVASAAEAAVTTSDLKRRSTVFASLFCTEAPGGGKPPSSGTGPAVGGRPLRW